MGMFILMQKTRINSGLKQLWEILAYEFSVIEMQDVPFV